MNRLEWDAGRPATAISERPATRAVIRDGEIRKTRERQNGFDLLRLILALGVVYTHAHLLGGFGDEVGRRLTRGQVNAGVFGVLGFFGISGFLVSRSFATRKDWRLFVRARALRILPGFFSALLLTAFVFAPLITYFDGTGTGWRLADAIRYVVSNAGVRLGQASIGGITAHLPYPGSLNGALWSLFAEVCCYGGILVLGVLGCLRKPATLVAALVPLGVLHAATVLAPSGENTVPTLLSLTGWAPYVTAFAVGTLVYSFRDHLELGRRQAVLWWLMVIVSLRFGGWALLGPVALPFALVHLAYSMDVEFSADFSYGIYILHFPILQALSAAGIHHRGLGTYLACGLGFALLFAALSWYLIESPMLKLKRAPSNGVG